jgi:hypothetical protein
MVSLPSLQSLPRAKKATVTFAFDAPLLVFALATALYRPWNPWHLFGVTHGIVQTIGYLLLCMPLISLFLLGGTVSSMCEQWQEHPQRNFLRSMVALAAIMFYL